MKIGILGGGGISDTHARAAISIPGVDVAAVYSRTLSHAERLTAKYGGTPFDNLARFLDHRPMDAVAIGSPSGLHADHGIAAAERGLHVLVEKPLDVTTARADALIAAADRAGVTLGVFFQDRLKPDVARIKTAVDAGDLGRPVLISGRVKWHRPREYYAKSEWRGRHALEGGGALINQGIHTLDLMLWLFGPIAGAYGRVATRVHDVEVEDTAAAVLEFRSGAIGTIEATTSVFPGYARRLEVSGDSGTLILENDRLVSVDLRGAQAGAGRVDRARAENVSSPVVSDATDHRRVIEDFMDAIRTKRPPACDGPEGRKSVEAVEKIYASAGVRR